MSGDDPATNSGLTLSGEEMIDRGLDGAASLTAVFVGAAILVLLIACANVANLMLMRSAERRGEMAVRSALGGGRARLMAQSLAEPAVLAVCAGVAGTLLSYASIKILLRVVPTADFPSWLTFGIDGGMLLIVLAIVTIVVFGIGLAPARDGTRFDLVRALKVGGDNGVANSGVARSARRGMVVQLALSVVLFTGASLLVQTYRHLSSFDVGYPAEEIVELRPFFDRQRYPSDTAALEFAKAALKRARTLAGARQTALVGEVNQLSLSGLDQTLTRARQTIVRPSDLRVVTDGDSAHAISTPRVVSPTVRQFAVSDTYFATLGIRILQGRGLGALDVAGTQPVTVVSRRFADTYWPQQSPLGRTVQFGVRGTRLTVVGVVEDVRDLQSGSRGIHADPRLDTYMSIRQFVPWNPRVLIRGQGDVSGIQSAAQTVGRSVDPNVLTTSYTLARHLETQLLVTRVFGALAGLFAISGLALSLIGIYGIVGYGIAQRTREIGIRIALGGTSGDVLRLVLRESLRFVTIGLAAGLVASLLMSRGLRALLFGVSPTDPATYVAVCVLFGAVASFACYLPARRVTRVDPMVALRSD
jgi:putative ABC transport system permease protein